jgi:glycosyltransferase involved in cell wall biosynthesis
MLPRIYQEERMKKVLHIISSNQWRGGEQQVSFLFNSNSVDYEKYLFCPEGSELIKRNLHHREKIFTYKKRLGADIAAALKLKSVCSQNKIDLLHIHDSHAINTYLVANLLGMNIPAVVHRHVNYPPKNKWKYKFSNIEKIICVSEEVKNTMSNAVDIKKLFIVHPAIDVQKFSSVAEDKYLGGELAIPSGKKIIGVITSLEKEKNVEEFISIATALLGKRGDLFFIIAGDGSERKKIEKLSSKLKNIVLLGYRNDVSELLHVMDIFLFTSSNEGFPLVLLEAMAAKTPIVTTNSGGIKNMIVDGENGVLYQRGNIEDAVAKIEFLLNEEDTRNYITENASQFVRQFDVSLMNKEIEDVYSSLNL